MAAQINGHEPVEGVDIVDDPDADLNEGHEDEEENVGDDIWDQILDPNFGNNQNDQGVAGNNELALHDLILGDQNIWGIHHHHPPPQQVPHAYRNGSATPQPASSSPSDAQSSVAFDESEFLAASSPPKGESCGGFVNEAYQTDSSELSDFVASTESQRGASLTSSNEACFKFGSFLEIPRRLEKDLKSTIQALRTSTEDDTEKLHPNPPNTPASVGDSLNLSDRVLDTSPKVPVSPSESLRTVIEALNSRLQDSRKRFETNARRSPRNIMAGVSEPGNVLQTASSITQVNADQIPKDDPDEENIQVSLAGRPAVTDNMFMKFGSFMVILVLLFPLAIIACLQGLLPEKYTTAFLVLWVMSFIGAFYCFMKACRNRNEESPDITGPAVRYGSIGNSNTGTSEPAEIGEVPDMN